MQLSRNDEQCYRYQSHSNFLQNLTKTCLQVYLSSSLELIHLIENRPISHLSFFYSYDEIMAWVETEYAGINSTTNSIGIVSFGTINYKNTH